MFGRQSGRQSRRQSRKPSRWQLRQQSRQHARRHKSRQRQAHPSRSSRASHRSRPLSERLLQLWRYLQGMLAAMLMMACIAAMYWGWQRLHDPDVLPFKHINFSGKLQHVAPIKLQHVVEQHLDGGFFVLNLNSLRQALQAQPWVYQVAIRRIWPDTLDIHLTEQIAIARWGKASLINKHYHIFTPAESTVPQHLPQINAPSKQKHHVLAQYQKIAQQLATIDLNIKSLAVDQRHSWRITLNNGIVVVIGQHDILERTHRFIRLYPKLIRAKAADIEQVDLRYIDGLAIKWKGVKS